MKQEIKDYLNKQGIKTVEGLAQHIIELKRNTVVPDIMFDLVGVLVNEKDCLLNFFAENKKQTNCTNTLGYDPSKFVMLTIDKETKPSDAILKLISYQWVDDSEEISYWGGKKCINIDEDEDKILEEWGMTCKQYLEWLESVEKNAINKARQEKVKTVLDDMLGKEYEGVKHNNGKPQISLLFRQFPKALEAIAKCSEYGHEKYKDTDQDYLNYQRVEGGSKAYADAGLRHRLFKEGTTDLDSQLPHSYHTCWNALAELELLLMKR